MRRPVRFCRSGGDAAADRERDEALGTGGQMEERNVLRREEEKKIADRIAAQIQKNPAQIRRRILVFSGEDFQAGVVGIVWAPAWSSGLESPV